MATVVIVIPARNEEKHLSKCVESLLDDEYPRDCLDLVIVDGCSTDATLAVAMALKERHPFIRILKNEKRLQAAGFNLVLTLDADYFLRADAHAIYPRNFVSTALSIAKDHKDAALIVFGDSPLAYGRFQQAVAFAQNTPFGVGNSHYRLGNRSLYVDHGKQGLFRADVVRALGGYDEAFSHNEDSELSYRIRQAGYKIWLDKALTVGYVPRSSIVALARQYWFYGKGRAQNVFKHKLRLRPRQLAPVVLVGASPLLIAGGWYSYYAWLPLAGYAVSVVAVSSQAAWRKANLNLLLATAAFPVMHFAWGAGFICCYMQALVGVE